MFTFSARRLAGPISLPKQNVISSRARKSSPADMRWVNTLTELLDNKFRIPGTNIRFGADFLMGLVPGAGDLLSMGFSGVLISTMAKNGASGRLVARMLLNVILDTIVGSVPILGNVFDLFYKANHRNLKLMNEHYQEGKHTGSVWPVMLFVFAVMVALFLVSAFAIVFLFKTIWNLV